VQLADALSCGGVQFYSGTFSAVSYNVTSATYSANFGSTSVINMGSGTWTATASGTAWSAVNTAVVNPGTATILLSDTTTTARTFAGGGLSYPKLTIGGATGVSTTTITGNNTFAEIASTKTVASTLSLAATIQTVGAWTAAGTAGNILTVSGTSAASPGYLVLTGSPTTSAVDYLNISNVRATPLETTWYAGANSVNNGSLGWIFSAGSGAVVITVKGNFFLFF